MEPPLLIDAFVAPASFSAPCMKYNAGIRLHSLVLPLKCASTENSGLSVAEGSPLADARHKSRQHYDNNHHFQTALKGRLFGGIVTVVDAKIVRSKNSSLTRLMLL